MTKHITCTIIFFLLSLLIINPAYSYDDIHNSYDKLLKKVVSDGLVNYKLLITNQQILNNYLKRLYRIKKEEYEKWDANDKLAFLINLYNAATLKLIIDNYPVKSIKEIGGIFFSPWKKKFITLFGKKVSLDFLEHQVIRKEFHEPRIHFALVCASKGCPPLRNEAYKGELLDNQLSEQTKQYLSSPRGLIIDKKKKLAYLSAIFKWYKEDFEDLIGFIKKYSGVDISYYKIKWLKYDWSLNEK